MRLSSLAQIRARPAIDGGRVYAISVGGILAAFDLRSGQRLWDRDIGGQQSPWIAGRQIYQIDNSGELICISADSGRIHWVTQLPAFKDEKNRKGPILWSGPVLAGDRLLVTGTDGRLLAVSAARRQHRRPADAGRRLQRRADDCRRRRLPARRRRASCPPIAEPQWPRCSAPRRADAARDRRSP